MSFNSLVFLIFLPIVLLLYWVIPQKLRWIFLLAASYFFYAFLNPWLIFLILSTTLVSYLCSVGIDKAKKKGTKTLFLILALVFTLGMLFVFKYLDFAYSCVVSLNHLFNGNMAYNPFNLILPVGISFYTFQTLSYVIDVYKGKYKAEYHFGYYALFVSFFPQLVAGPIERPENLIPQLKGEHRLSSKCFQEGLYYLVTGFAKKIVVADVLGLFVSEIYSNIPESSGLAVIIATVFFAIEIFCDFSGYSDIALGCASLMDIHLTQNFNHPYRANSVRDFWRRWHITLTSWLTDYIYIPLGGSKKGKARRIINTMIVFFVSGLWHGASWNFVLWGVLNGLLIVIELILNEPMSHLKEKLPKLGKVLDFLSVPFTFLLICCTWIFFRSSDISTAVNAYSRIFTSFISGSGLEYFSDIKITSQCLLAIVLVVLIPYLPKLTLKTDENGKPDYGTFTLQSLLYVSLVLLIAFVWMNQLGTHGESGFIYFQF